MPRTPFQRARSLPPPQSAANVIAEVQRLFHVQTVLQGGRRPEAPLSASRSSDVRPARTCPHWGRPETRRRAATSIRKYMIRPENPRDRSTTWLPFLRNHLDVSWAMDYFTVVTANFAFLYVFVVLDHGRRDVIHFAATYNPSMQWVIQQLREATPFGRQPGTCSATMTASMATASARSSSDAASRKS